VLANLRGLATVGLPETMLWAPVIESAGVVALVGSVLLARPSVSVWEIVAVAARPSARTRKVAGTLALVVLMLTSFSIGPVHISAVDTASAETTEEWSFSDANGVDAIETAKYDGENYLFIGYYDADFNRHLKLVHATNGTEVWDVPINYDIEDMEYNPESGRLYITGYNHLIETIDPENGAVIDSVDTGYLTLSLTTDEGGNVYAAIADSGYGGYMKYSQNLTENYTRNLNEISDGIAYSEKHDFVYIQQSSVDGADNIRAFSSSTGDEKWNRNISGIEDGTGVSTVNGNLYWTDRGDGENEEKRVRKFDGDSGDKIWETDSLGGILRL